MRSLGGNGEAGAVVDIEEANLKEAIEDEVNDCADSFDPFTPVLMADGHTKSIKDVKVGDEVMSTDPETRLTKAEKVVKLHDNHDTDLTIATATGTSVLHTTWLHPFWNATTHAWTSAGQLQVGSHLYTYGAVNATVISVHSWAGAHEMLNLTVNEVHSYYVVVDGVGVLVHNCSAANIHASPAASDWATKGAHLHIGNQEVRIYPTNDGGLGFEGIRLKSGLPSDAQVEAVRDAVMTDSDLRADLIGKARSAMQDMNNHNWGNSVNRAFEMHILIKNLDNVQ